MAEPGSSLLFQRERGRGGGVPGISRELRVDDLRCAEGAEPVEGLDIQVHVAGAEAFQVLHAEMEEPGGGAQAAAILRVPGTQELLLEMDKGPGDLDEALEEPVVLVVPLEPQVFEDVVRLIVTLLVEALEEAAVARMERFPVLNVELLGECRDALAFFHRCILLVSR